MEGKPAGGVMEPIRKKHSAGFKAKVAMEAARGQKTVAEIAREYSVHATQVQAWKKQLLEEAANIFDGNRRRDRTQEEKEAQLYEQIGKLQVEVEWLKKKSLQISELRRGGR